MALVLGIESSCDESSAAIVRDGRLVLAEVTARQEEVHQRWGGIVPELASRKHTESLLPAVRLCLEKSGVGYGDLTAIAVTNRPGLVGSLMIGVAAAKTLAYALGLPLIPINHLEAHLAAVLLNPGIQLEFPLLGLIISGGHTSLYEVDQDFTKFTLLGHTRDDAAGEAFDKGARLLGLPYPGGPEIARLAVNGSPNRFSLPRAIPQKDSLDFSFSGLKTAIQQVVSQNPDARPEDIAASLQEAIADALVNKTKLAQVRGNYRDVVVAGGVAANQRIRAKLRAALPQRVNLHFPEPRWCTDNGAMIAALGTIHWQKGNGLKTPAVFSLGTNARTEIRGKVS